MPSQLGFGFGKGRRVVKTTIAVEAATQALVKQQQRWVDAHWRKKREVLAAFDKAIELAEQSA